MGGAVNAVYRFTYTTRREGSIPMCTLAQIYRDAAAWLERNPGYDTSLAIGKATDRLSDQVASAAQIAFQEAFGAWIGNDDGIMALCFAAALADTSDL